MQERNPLRAFIIETVARRRRGIVNLSSACAALLLGAACAGQRESDRTGRAAAVALGIDGGVDGGPTGAPSANETAALRLDDLERRRLRDAARKAFGSPDGVTTAYTVVPWNIDAEPTAVSATPVGPAEDRAGGPCRPIRLSATKGGRTTIGTLTFCRSPGSSDIKISAKI